MAITPEQKQKLDDLLKDGIISQKEYDAKVTPPEAFDGKKLATGMLHVMNPVLWAKDFASIFNVRKLIIYALILGAIFGYGYMKGIGNKPVYLDVEGRQADIKLNGETLHINQDGTAELRDTKTGKKIRDITVKDVPGLQNALKPIGGILKPFALIGGGVGVGGADGKMDFGIEPGVGVSWYKFYSFYLDSAITTKGVYPLGVSKKINGTDNTYVGAAVGMGYKGDMRGLVYLKLTF